LALRNFARIRNSVWIGYWFSRSKKQAKRLGRAIRADSSGNVAATAAHTR